MNASKSFAAFLAEQQGHTNILFESGMYSLEEDLGRILGVLQAADIPYEVIGGAAVLAHILAAQKGRRSFLTKDIDLLLHRNDLPKLVQIAEQSSYRTQRILGGYALILPEQVLGEAVHILFTGEKPRSSYPVSNPLLNPVTKLLFGLEIPVAPIKDLLTLKLNSNRAKDIVHIELLDRADLISPDIERQLDVVLQTRLKAIRSSYEEENVDE